MKKYFAAATLGIGLVTVGAAPFAMDAYLKSHIVTLDPVTKADACVYLTAANNGTTPKDISARDIGKLVKLWPSSEVQAQITPYLVYGCEAMTGTPASPDWAKYFPAP